MKKVIIFLILMLFPINVFASSGKLIKSSIMECDGVKYGYHGSDKHYHEAVNKNGSWYATGDILNPSCLKSTESDDEDIGKSSISTDSVDKKEDNETLSTVSVDRDVVTLLKCVDGDTAHFKLNNQDIKVRFLAINTPESTNKKEFYGKEASNYVCNKLKNAKLIELEYDGESDKTDKYGRTLAWIYTDNNNLQIDLVEKGYAEVKYIYGDYKYLDELYSYEKNAKKQKIGMWQNTSNTEYSKYIYIILGIIIITVSIFTGKKIKFKKRS